MYDFKNKYLSYLGWTNTLAPYDVISIDSNTNTTYTIGILSSQMSISILTRGTAYVNGTTHTFPSDLTTFVFTSNST